MNLNQSNLEVSNAGKLARDNVRLVLSARKCSAAYERRGAKGRRNQCQTREHPRTGSISAPDWLTRNTLTPIGQSQNNHNKYK